jgi:hypothetical protein
MVCAAAGFTTAVDAAESPPLKWSILRYVFGQHGGPRCRARGTSPRRSSPSCARWTSWSRKAKASPTPRAIGVTEVTYYRWRQEYGGLKTEQVRRLKELETENARLRRAVADLTLDKLILKEAASGNH